MPDVLGRRTGVPGPSACASGARWWPSACSSCARVLFCALHAFNGESTGDGFEVTRFLQALHLHLQQSQMHRVNHAQRLSTKSLSSTYMRAYCSARYTASCSISGAFSIIQCLSSKLQVQGPQDTHTPPQMSCSARTIKTPFHRHSIVVTFPPRRFEIAEPVGTPPQAMPGVAQRASQDAGCDNMIPLEGPLGSGRVACKSDCVRLHTL